MYIYIYIYTYICINIYIFTFVYRFLIIGFGNDTRVMMRDFRGDEPEIEESVEQWRLLIGTSILDDDDDDVDCNC
jgi:hypothetical protein